MGLTYEGAVVCMAYILACVTEGMGALFPTERHTPSSMISHDMTRK